jgi:hypothetical protein
MVHVTLHLTCDTGQQVSQFPVMGMLKLYLVKIDLFKKIVSSIMNSASLWLFLEDSEFQNLIHWLLKKTCQLIQRVAQVNVGITSAMSWI